MELKQLKHQYMKADFRLLIVPYGIETVEQMKTINYQMLLIVPYGIETTFPKPFYFFQESFNRTLWN